MDATTGPLITHQRAVFSFVSQHLEEEEREEHFLIVVQRPILNFFGQLVIHKYHKLSELSK